MADTNETIADIIAEMRGARTEFPFVYLMGEPDTPEVIDYRTKEIVEPRKINIRRVTVTELADRLEVALRRDCASIERIVRDAILGYGEMFRTAPNDESEAELKARAETANIWLERHGFTREEITWTKEED